MNVIMNNNCRFGADFDGDELAIFGINMLEHCNIQTNNKNTIAQICDSIENIENIEDVYYDNDHMNYTD